MCTTGEYECTNYGVQLDNHNFIKYLDVNIDKNLTWDIHVNHISRKIS